MYGKERQKSAAGENLTHSLQKMYAQYENDANQMHHDSRPAADQMNIQDRALTLLLYTLAREDVVRGLLRKTNSLIHTRTLYVLHPRLCAVIWLRKGCDNNKEKAPISCHKPLTAMASSECCDWAYRGSLLRLP